MESGLPAPFSFSLKHFGDIVEICHRLCSGSENPVKPYRVADTYKVLFIGNIKTESSPGLRNRSYFFLHFFRLLFSYKYFYIIHNTRSAVVSENRKMVSRAV